MVIFKGKMKVNTTISFNGLHSGPYCKDDGKEKKNDLKKKNCFLILSTHCSFYLT